ncbi:MAG: threonine--tRNA ligase [Planctomycetota bacterium]
MIKVTLPDGSDLELPDGSTVEDLAGQIGPGLKKAALAGKVNGVLRDLKCPVERDAVVEIITEKSEDALEMLRHSTSHLMAQAVLRLFPEAKLAIGPPIEDGFYYDIDLEHTITEEDLAKIEKTMKAIVKENLTIERREIVRSESIDEMKGAGDIYKVEMLEEMEDDTVTYYSQGEFTDLCRGPHLPSTGRIPAFKLLHTAGAYWRGDSSRKMLQRIYGTAFYSKKDLNDHLQRLEEAKKRDHRKIGKQLDLFSFHPEAPASPFFHPKGAFLYNTLVNHIRGLYKEYGYEEVITPQILTTDLWHRSGHYENYQENMFFTNFDEREYAVKPMNCPTHALIFGTKIRSYRDLPIRLADFGRLHRYELSGVTAGLTRVRTFAQDDAHIFCMQEQIEQEVNSLIEMYLKTYRLFGFDDCKIYLATKPEKYIGSDEIWEYSEKALQGVMEKSDHPFQIDPGEGVFYGPKIDFKVYDAMRREWQLGTIQLDFSMPERFDLEYTAQSGNRLRPVMIHRAMLGSIERFLGVYIEHTAGNFPLWLNPVQVRIIAVSDSHIEYCEKIEQELASRKYRVETDFRNETIGHKIREATLEKVSFMIIIGDREIQNSNISLRERREGDLGGMSLEDFFALLDNQMQEKT